MPDRTVADLVVDRLRAAGGDPEFIPARHGETAAFMATDLV